MVASLSKPSGKYGGCAGLGADFEVVKRDFSSKISNSSDWPHGHPQGFHSNEENQEEPGASLENACLCDERGSWPRESKAGKHPKYPSSCFKSNGAFLNKHVLALQSPLNASTL